MLRKEKEMKAGEYITQMILQEEDEKKKKKKRVIKLGFHKTVIISVFSCKIKIRTV
jgi:hypothetical protein